MYLRVHTPDTVCRRLKEDVGEAGAGTKQAAAQRKEVSQQLATMPVSHKAAATALLHSQSPIRTSFVPQPN